MFFDYDEKLKAQVKSVRHATYSSTNRCFYVDDSEENLMIILKTMKDVADVDISLLIKKESEPVDRVAARERLEPEQSDAQDDFMDEKTDEAIPRLNSENKEVNNLSERDTKHDIQNRGDFGPVEFRISEKEGLLIIKFLGMYNGEWIKEMKSYGHCSYDKKRKEWLLPWSKIACDSLEIGRAHV